MAAEFRSAAWEWYDLGIVTAPRVRIAGRIAAKEKLTVAERADARPGWRPLAGFTPDRGETFAFREVFDLAPGRQTLRFRAGTAEEGE